MRGDKLVVAVVSTSCPGTQGWSARCLLTMQKTAMLIAVITIAVPHFSFVTIFWVSQMIAIRLMIICMRICTSKTQQNRMKNNTVTLLAEGH